MPDSPVELRNNDVQAWRLVMDVQFVPPGSTAKTEDGREIAGPVLLEGPPRWERP